MSSWGDLAVPPRTLLRPLAALKIQARIVGALMMREAMTHYGRESLGFFWLIAEPMILTIGVMIMWTITGTGHGHGLGVIPFALSGYSLLTIFRHIIGNSTHMFRRGAGLMFHQNIHLLDIFLAHHLLSAMGTMLAFFVTYTFFYLTDFIEGFKDPLLVIGGFALIWFYASGMGLIISCMTELYEPVERFVHPIMYITLPFTGCFYMVDWLPEKMQYYVLVSPQVHIGEMLRDGMYGDTIDTFWNLSYILIWSLGFWIVGLSMLARARSAVAIQ